MSAAGPSSAADPGPDRARLEGLARAARRGLVFTGGTYLARSGLEFGTSVALARLLSPGDFGVVAVGQAFLQLSWVVGNFGMGVAVVQARDLSETDRRAATLVSTVSALLLALACAAAAPWAASFFAMPVLRAAMPIMAGEIVLSGLAATPIAILRRRLHYGRAAVVDGGSGLVYAVVSITLAYLGHGVWSLVWTPLVSGAWSVVASHALAGHRPGLGADRASLRRLLSFGGGLTAKNLFVHMARHADNLVVARMLGDFATGLYTRAFSVSTLPQSRLVSLIYGVSFPVFCRLQDDREKFHDWYLKATSVATIIVTPLLLGLAVLAPDFTVVVYGEAWADMSGCLRVLCIAGLLNSIHMLGGAAIEASGRLRYEVAAHSAYGLMVPLAAFVGSRWGIEGVAYGVLIAAAVFYVNKAWALRRAIGLDITAYISATLPILASGVVMAIAVQATRVAGASLGWTESPLARLAAGVAAGALTYGICLGTLARRHWRMALDQIVAMRAVGGREKGMVTPAATPRAGASMAIVHLGHVPLEAHHHLRFFEACARHARIVYLERGPHDEAHGATAFAGAPGLERRRVAPVLPGDRLGLIARWNWWLAARASLASLGRQGVACRVLVTQKPDMLPTLRGLGADLTVYSIVDDYVGLADKGTKNGVASGHRRMLRQAGMVWALSEVLAADARRIHANVHLVRQGVDHDAFASAASAPPPPSMATIAGPRVGSVGNLNDRVDWTLVEGIARSRPGWNVVLVGPIYQAGPRTLEALPRLRLLPNVHLLPEVPPGDLPGMVAHLDVGLIIYAPGPGTLAINPLKLYQYLAAGRAVVSTPLPSVEEFRGTVAIARTVEEFVAAIEAALAPPEAAPAAARARRVLEFDWEQVAALRLELLHDALRARGRPAPDAPGR